MGKLTLTCQACGVVFQSEFKDRTKCMGCSLDTMKEACPECGDVNLNMTEEEPMCKKCGWTP